MSLKLTLVPPWSWSLTSLMFCLGSDHVPSGIPAAPADFRQEEHEGGC